MSPLAVMFVNVCNELENIPLGSCADELNIPLAPNGKDSTI